MNRTAQQRLTPATGTSSYRGDEAAQVPCAEDAELWFGDEVEQNAAKRICWNRMPARRTRRMPQGRHRGRLQVGYLGRAHRT